jgi:hypothetical protein
MEAAKLVIAGKPIDEITETWVPLVTTGPIVKPACILAKAAVDAAQVTAVIIGAVPEIVTAPAVPNEAPPAAAVVPAATVAVPVKVVEVVEAAEVPAGGTGACNPDPAIRSGSEKLQSVCSQSFMRLVAVPVAYSTEEQKTLFAHSADS